ncbi:hypothetical protein MJO28_017926 [Puccinia striiformis f. sp. tritici]|nr:hypothetical protein MJO28_017926 [Puccinia striiformis f. sp. tritici]
MENGLMSSFETCLDSIFHKGSIADAIGLSKKNISLPFEGFKASESNSYLCDLQTRGFKAESLHNVGQAKKSFSKPRVAY